MTNNNFDILIIGAGLGGLLCANILSKEGFNVCLIEKNNRIGGSIQSFTRNKVLFNTGLNYTESLGEGEVLYRYFKYFNIIDKIRIKQLDINCFEKISFENDDNEYPFAQGYDNFVDQLSAFFPNERSNLSRYITDMKEICHSFPYYTFDLKHNGVNTSKYFSTCAFNYLNQITNNHRLNQILGGITSLYAGDKNTTPLYVHSLINYSFIKSAWRFVDGGSHLAMSIFKEIKANGTTVYLNQKVTSIGGDKCAEYVRLENGEKIYAKKIISNLHPQNTFNIVDENINKYALKTRINSLKNTIGMFTVYLVLKNQSFPYINNNFHHFKHVNTWTTDYIDDEWPEHYMLYTPVNPTSDVWANSVIIITYMKYEEVEKWKNTYLENRGDEYLAFKQNKTEKLLDYVYKKFPTLKECIQEKYSSTPLTYRDYTGTPNGSAYGIIKNYNDPISTIIKPKTRVGNLYLTGQNLNMHGILGVSIGAVHTCAEIVGSEYLYKKIQNA